VAETIKLPFINMESETWDSQLNYLFFTIGRIKLLTTFRGERKFPSPDLQSSKESLLCWSCGAARKSTLSELLSSKESLLRRSCGEARIYGSERSQVGGWSAWNKVTVRSKSIAWVQATYTLSVMQPKELWGIQQGISAEDQDSGAHAQPRGGVGGGGNLGAPGGSSRGSS